MGDGAGSRRAVAAGTPSTEEPPRTESPPGSCAPRCPSSRASYGLRVHCFSFHRFTQNLSVFRRDVAEALRSDGHTDLSSLDMMS